MNFKSRVGVRSCYDEGKRMAETLTMDYHRGDGVEVKIARIFNTYGPRMCLDDGRVVNNFVSQFSICFEGHPQTTMTVYGDGKQTRSFQYVSDLLVKETIDESAAIEFRENTADDRQKRKPDISKAKELLNWEPKVPLREGLPKMAFDFRNRILNENEGIDRK
ncbi:putative UDP-glucuronate decarboxylase [Helianthus annuus]|uniref:Putative NAD(P)-binding domain-containing protein n=1 Tax=Helianthus annuus TaxID=4232 RepID=A0A251SRK5_HELAN|nr:putative UDP-glucuronate decarboxylase [Helianthus annuus]